MATAYDFRQGIYWLRRRFGGGGVGTPVVDCFLLLLSGAADNLLFLDGDNWRLLGCGIPSNFLLLSGPTDEFLLLNGNSLGLLSG